MWNPTPRSQSSSRLDLKHYGKARTPPFLCSNEQCRLLRQRQGGGTCTLRKATTERNSPAIPGNSSVPVIVPPPASETSVSRGTSGRKKHGGLTLRDRENEGLTLRDRENQGLTLRENGMEGRGEWGVDERDYFGYDFSLPARRTVNESRNTNTQG